MPTLSPDTNTDKLRQTKDSAERELHLRGEKEANDHQEEIRTNRNDKLHTRTWRAMEIEEEEAERLQKATCRNNIQPIWAYRIRQRASTSAKNIALQKMDGLDCQ